MSIPVIPAKFVVDDSPVFSGYDTRGMWNGFATPFFTREVCEDILKFCAGEDGSQMSWRYTNDGNMLEFWSPDDGVDEETGEPNSYMHDYVEFETTDGQIVGGFELGAYSWVWTTVDEDKDYSEYDFEDEEEN